MTKLVQLTDPHLLANPRDERWGLNPNTLFETVLKAAIAEQPDALLLTGDLVHDESEAGYQRLHRQVSASGIPLLAIPGNHDSPDLIQQYFGKAELVLNNLTVVGLNSHIRGSDCGFLGSDELNRLEQILNRAQQPLLLAIHHPPIAVGSMWIDELSLADSDAFLALVHEYADNILAIISGHVHQQYESSIAGVPMLTCPSTNRQFAVGADHFACDRQAPGYRVLNWQAAQFSSQIIRVA